VRDARHLLGREAEAGEVDRFLAAVAAAPAALLLDGEPGIGKTTLWQYGVDQAARRGVRVLAARPTPPEATLGYAALGDLAADLDDDALAELPAPQRLALDVALLRAEPGEREPPQRAVALGLLGALRRLARDAPVVVAVDDEQWLDRPSVLAVGFALRRLRDERVGLLASRRVEAGARAADDLVGAPAAMAVRRLRLGPLAAPALARLLAARAGVELPSRTLARIHALSGGNPFYALELAASLERPAEPLVADADLRIPQGLQDLVRERLDGLGNHGCEMVEIAAAVARPTVGLLAAASGRADAEALIGRAERAGMLERDGERVRVAHPLFASVAYARIAEDRRRALHARLAGLIPEPEERATHLALASAAPDADVAAELESAARRARGRGAPDAAADLDEHARRLTPPELGTAARRRGLEAAARRLEAGDPARARALLEEVAAEAPAGDERALALARLGWVTAHAQGLHAAAEVFAAARAEEPRAPALRIEIEQGLAWCIHSSAGRPAAAAHANAALALAEELGDPAILAGALTYAAFMDSLGGRGIRLDRVERAERLGGPSPPWSQIIGRPDWIHALLLQWHGDLAGSHARFTELRRRALDQGDVHALPFITFQLARVELQTGDWDAAEAHARECRELTDLGGLVGEESYACAIEALVAAHRGRADDARAAIAQGLAAADAAGTEPAALELRATLGFLELSLGRHRAAARPLDTLRAAVEQTDLREPGLFRYHGDAIEVDVALGRRDAARALIEEADESARTLGRAWMVVVAERGRALLLAAEGDPAGAAAAIDRALAAQARLGQPFEEARTLLVKGGIARRSRQKAAARAALERALATFDALGARAYAERARSELARVGGRAPSDGLTETEARIAEIVAAGRSYREAADALFISPKTVQWNLSKVYRKLGIRSRAELPARLAALAAEEGGPVPAGGATSTLSGAVADRGG
jgi:DNA-binding CsgD family transcriptional regulator